jgi:hypothetical protein
MSIAAGYDPKKFVRQGKSSEQWIVRTRAGNVIEPI